jgi:hypothetical protein
MMFVSAIGRNSRQPARLDSSIRLRELMLQVYKYFWAKKQ